MEIGQNKLIELNGQCLICGNMTKNQIELNGRGIIYESMTTQSDRAKRSRYNL